MLRRVVSGVLPVAVVAGFLSSAPVHAAVAPPAVISPAVAPVVLSPAVVPQEGPPSSTYENAVLADTPTLYYRFDESAGSTSLADSSGRDIAGLALPGGGPLKAGANGALSNETDTAASFGSYNPKLLTSVAAGLPAGNAARSVEWWMRGTGGPFSFGWGGYKVLVSGSTITMGNTAVSLPINLAVDSWHHVAVTYTPATRLASVYLDGLLAASATGGADQGNADGQFQLKGESLLTDPSVRLDELTVYSSTLSPERILAHFDASGNTRPTAPSNVVASGGAGVVDATWSPATASTPDGLPQISSYRVSVFSGTKSVESQTILPTATSAHLTGLAAGRYTVKVKALNSFGSSDLATSATTTVTEGPSYASTIKADSPLLYYRFGEAFGAPSFADSSGRDVRGLDFTTSATLRAGEDNKHVPTTSALANDPDASAFFGNYNAYVSTDGKVGLPTGNAARSVDWWMDSKGGPFSLGWGGFTIEVRGASLTIAGTPVPIPVNLLVDAWHHVAVTYTPSSHLIRVYVDGLLAGQATLPGDLNTTDAPFVFKGLTYLSDANVRLDELAVYGSTLSAGRILTHFNASGNSRPTAPTDVVATGGQGAVSATWSPATGSSQTGLAGVTGYKVSVADGTSTIESKWLPANATSATLTGLAAGNYTVSVAAANGYGTGPVASAMPVDVVAAASSEASAIRADAPKLYFRMGDAAGAPWYADSSGRSTPGLDLATNALTAGQTGALLADTDSSARYARSDAVSTAADPGLGTGNHAHSIEWWMRADNGSGSFSYNWGGYKITVNATTITAGALNIPLSVNLFTNVWHQVALTYAPSSRDYRVYVDGQLAGNATASADLAIGTGQFQIKGENLAASPALRLDEVAVFSSTLSATKILNHFNAAGVSRPNAPANVAAAGGVGVIDVTWDSSAVTSNVADGLPQVTGYEVTVLKSGKPLESQWVSASESAARLTGLAAGTYTVSVASANNFGSSEAVRPAAAVRVVAGSSYASTVRNDSPTLYYRFGDSSSAPFVADSSGRSVKGLDLIAGGPLVPGQTGGLVADTDRSTKFAGYNPTVATTNVVGLPTGNSARSIEWWMNSSGGPFSFKWGGFEVNVNGSTITAANAAIALPNTLSDSAWHYVVVTYTPDTRLFQVYVNGVLSGQANIAGNLTTTDDRFTIRGTSLTADPNVRLDELAVYPTTLTTDQIAAHYSAANAGNPGLPLPPTNIRIQALGHGQATVSWNPPPAPGGRLPELYKVTQSSNGVVQKVISLKPDATSVDVDGLKPGTPYDFAVGAQYGDTDSQPSESTASYTPMDDQVDSGPATFAVGTAYKAFAVGNKSGDPSPCGQSDSINWTLYGGCDNPGSYGTGLIMVRNTGDVPFAASSLTVDFANGCQAGTSPAYTGQIMPGNAEVLGGYLSSFDTDARCGATIATVRLTINGQQYSYQDTNLATGDLKTRSWRKIGGVGDLLDSTRCGCVAADPVDVEAGTFHENYDLLSIPNRGIGLDFSLRYNSAVNARDGSFGYGWGSNLISTLSIDRQWSDRGVVVRQQDGTEMRFSSEDGSKYTTASNVHAKLTRNKQSGQYTLVKNKTEILTYDNRGLLLSDKDLNGDGLLYSYDALRRVVKVAGTSGASLTVAYDGDSTRVTSVTGPMRRSVQLHYDGDNLASFTEPTGESTTFTYAGRHLMTDVADATGPVTHNDYDSSRRVTSQTDAAGAVTTFTYDSSSTRVVAPAAGGSAETDYKFNQGRLASVTRAAGTADQSVSRFEYDPDTGYLLKEYKPNGSQVTRTYDDDGNVLTTTDELGHVTHIAYDSLNDPTVTISPSGIRHEATYDSRGNVLTTSAPNGDYGQITTRYSYDDAAHPGDVTSVTNPRGGVTTTAYNTMGLPVRVVSATGEVSTFTYNSAGQVVTAVSAAGNVPGAVAANYTTTYRYRSDGRPSSVTDGMGRLSTITYGPGSRVASTAGADGRKTTYEYDALGHVVTKTLPGSVVQHSTYDAAGNLTSFTDGAGHTQTLGYDALGRLITRTDAMGRTEQMTYDASDHVLTDTRIDGSVVSYSYDAGGRVSSVTYPDPSLNTTYTYDADGNNTSVTDGTGTVESRYDAAGRLASVRDAADNIVSYGYDPSGQQNAIAYPSGRIVHRDFDLSGRLTSLTDGSDGTFSFTYGTDGALSALSYPNGVRADITRDARSQVTSIVDTTLAAAGISPSDTPTPTPTATAEDPSASSSDEPPGDTDASGDSSSTAPASDDPSAGATTSGSVSASVDPSASAGASDDSSPDASTSDDPSSSADASGDSAASVDAADGPSTAASSSGAVSAPMSADDVLGSVFASFSYTRTSAGLISGTRETGQVTLNQSMTYDALSRLTKSGDTGASAWSVDKANNLIKARGLTQTYDASDRLLSTATPGGATTYSYDARGNRIGVTRLGTTASSTFDAANRMTSDAAGTSYGFTGDGLRAWSQAPSGDRHDWSWDRSPTVALLLTDGVNDYIYGPAGLPLEQAPLTGNPDDRVFLHTDATGSVRTGTDTAGSQVWSRSFDAYGTTLTVWTAPGYTGTPSPLAWQSQYQDPGTSHYYLRARVYDPTTGTYTSIDPLFLLTGTAYRYVAGDPLNAGDPLGLVDLSGIGSFIADNSGTIATIGAIAVCAATAGVGCAIAGAAAFAIGAAQTIQSDAENCQLGWGTAGKVALDGLLALAGAGIGRAAGDIAERYALRAAARAEAEKGGLTLFKFGDATSTRATGWRDGDRFLRNPDYGSAHANWRANAGLLRAEMRSGRPIYDSYVDASGNLIPTKGFLGAERNLLVNHGWTFDPGTGAWTP